MADQKTLDVLSEALEHAGRTIDELQKENSKLRDAQYGCICPPTSELTCKNPLCPRRGIQT